MEIQNYITNFTNNGECSRCNQCCGGALPMTPKELKIIKDYVKKNNIRPVANSAAIMINPLDLSCPFSYKDRCNIYEVRPLICRIFICSMSTEKAHEQKERLYMDPHYKQFFLRDEIFGEKTAQRFMKIMEQSIL